MARLAATDRDELLAATLDRAAAAAATDRKSEREDVRRAAMMNCRCWWDGTGDDGDER